MRSVATVAGLSLAASLLLSGCSGGFFGGGSGQGGGGTSGDGQSGTSGDGPVAEDPVTPDDGGTDGGVTETGGVPADFPVDIPLIDEPVSVGVSMGTGWTVIFTVDDAEASYTEQSTLLLGAGFTSMGDARSPDGSAGAYDGPNYTVQMTSSTGPDPSVLVVVQTKN